MIHPFLSAHPPSFKLLKKNNEIISEMLNKYICSCTRRDCNFIYRWLMCMAYKQIWGGSCWWPRMIENLELRINYTLKTNDGEATSWGVKWEANAWNGKKIGCYDFIEIKRATARISRRARRLGMRTCTRLCGVWLISAVVWLKLVEQTLVTPGRGGCGPAVLQFSRKQSHRHIKM